MRKKLTAVALAIVAATTVSVANVTHASAISQCNLAKCGGVGVHR